MAGNTSKMTKEAIRAKGPRMVLTSIYNSTEFLGFVIRREGAKGTVIDAGAKLRLPWAHHVYYRVYAKSYSLSYLMRVGRNYLRWLHQ